MFTDLTTRAKHWAQWYPANYFDGLSAVWVISLLLYLKLDYFCDFVSSSAGPSSANTFPSPVPVGVVGIWIELSDIWDSVSASCSECGSWTGELGATEEEMERYMGEKVKYVW